MDLETLNGQPASILGLAGSQGMDTSCVAAGFEAGVNYFFFYDISHENLLSELKVYGDGQDAFETRWL